MKDLNIAIDVDGVLRNTFIGIAKAYVFNGGHKYFGLKDFTDYDFTNMMNIENKEQFFRDNAETIFLNSKPMPYTHEIERLQDYGKIQIVTSQFKGLEDMTVWWLQKNNIPYDELHFTWDKYSVNTDILLDDLPENLHKMPRSVIKVCYDAPYNHKWSGSRVRNMKEFVGLVAKINDNGGYQ